MTFFVEHAPALAIAIPLFAAFAMPVAGKAGRRAVLALSLIASSATLAIVLVLASSVLSDGIRTYSVGATLPSLTSPAGFPIRIMIEVDAMSALMALISAALPLIACLYSARYMKPGAGLPGYFTLLMLMTAGMIGLVTVGDLFSMFVFLEILSVSSGAIIAYHSRRGESAEAGLKFVMISSVGALMVLMATAFLYGQYNALNIAALAGSVRSTGLDMLALALLVSAFAMKCGAVPMHMWVADAYGEAPAPVSAVLVVGSQASLYALFRVCFTIFGASALIHLAGWALIAFGVLSMFIGVTMAIPQSDIKRLMAYHAVSQTGYMLLGAGVCLSVIGDASAVAAFGQTALQGGIFHLLNHALYKGLLFLAAGAIIYRTGTRNINEMGGLARAMPFTALFFIIGMLAIAGLPPFNGFASKLMIYESVFMLNPLLSVVAMAVSVLTLASFVKVFCAAFLGPPAAGQRGLSEVPLAMRIAMGVLAFFIILLGLMPGLAVDGIVAPAASALLDRLSYIGGVI